MNVPKRILKDTMPGRLKVEIKGIIDEDFINYKKPSMVILSSNCSFKCDKECGKNLCQNSDLAALPSYKIPSTEIVERYLKNPITEALVISGLEPFDRWNELQELLMNFRYYSPDDIVIYTGYYPEELTKDQIDWLTLYAPVIVKYGRYIPNKAPRFDDVLGVKLVSDNQYAMRYDF